MTWYTSKKKIAAIPMSKQELFDCYGLTTHTTIYGDPAIENDGYAVLSGSSTWQWMPKSDFEKQFHTVSSTIVEQDIKDNEKQSKDHLAECNEESTPYKQIKAVYKEEPDNSVYSQKIPVFGYDWAMAQTKIGHKVYREANMQRFTNDVTIPGYVIYRDIHGILRGLMPFGISDVYCDDPEYNKEDREATDWCILEPEEH